MPARARHSGEYTRRSSRANLADIETGDTRRVRPVSPSAPRPASTTATAPAPARRRLVYLVDGEDVIIGRQARYHYT